MRKKIIALLLAVALLASTLCACNNQAADRFFELAEEMSQLEDVSVALVIPYHGVSLTVNGYICRSSQTADLTVSFVGTDGQDGDWTELRIDGDRLWLNVGELARKTLEFDLPAYYAGDIEEFLSEQTDDWVTYTWQGDFWDSIPGWDELLGQLWENSKETLKKSISAQGDGYRLSLSGNALDKALTEIATDLVDDTDAYEEGFVSMTSLEGDLMLALQMDGDALFESYWSALTEYLYGEDSTENAVTDEVVDADESGEEDEDVDADTGEEDAASETTESEETLALESVILDLSLSETSYGAALLINETDAWSLTLTPMDETLSIDEPENAMEFGYYRDTVYYLVSLSNNYLGDLLDGVELDEETEQSYLEAIEAENTVERDDLETAAVADYNGLLTIQFYPGEEDSALTVPILGSYVGATVTSSDGAGVQVTDLSLSGTGWYETVSAEEKGEDGLQAFLTDDLYDTYNAYLMSGYLLVEDLSGLTTSSTGTGAVAQGFSYREDDYSEPIVKIRIGLPLVNCDYNTVIDLQLTPSEMREADMAAVEQLFAYLGLDVPVNLDI
ncbi:MAG: hypothetical protein LUH48_09130 [Clostridiales bacterium]|nr:hypothetical protein [Clostridiales bacterium]